MKNSQNSSSALTTFVLPISLVCLFALSALFLTFMGSETYRTIKKNFDATSDTTVSVSYLSTKIRQHNEQGAIAVAKTADGDRLLLTETLGGRIYETAIYCSGGNLYEAYYEKGGTSLEDPMRISSLRSMTVTLLSRTLVQIDTVDAGDRHHSFTVNTTGVTEVGGSV